MSSLNVFDMQNITLYMCTQREVRNFKSHKFRLTSGPVFHKFLTPAPDPRSKEKQRILPESTLALCIRGHL